MPSRRDTLIIFGLDFATSTTYSPLRIKKRALSKKGLNANLRTDVARDPLFCRGVLHGNGRDLTDRAGCTASPRQRVPFRACRAPGVLEPHPGRFCRFGRGFHPRDRPLRAQRRKLRGEPCHVVRPGEQRGREAFGRSLV